MRGSLHTSETAVPTGGKEEGEHALLHQLALPQIDLNRSVFVKHRNLLRENCARVLGRCDSWCPFRLRQRTGGVLSSLLSKVDLSGSEKGVCKRVDSVPWPHDPTRQAHWDLRQPDPSNVCPNSALKRAPTHALTLTPEDLEMNIAGRSH